MLGMHGIICDIIIKRRNFDISKTQAVISKSLGFMFGLF